jgi:hypothetical protein
MTPLAPDNEWFRLMSSRPTRRKALAELRTKSLDQAENLKRWGLIPVSAREQRHHLIKQVRNDPDIGLLHFLADILCLPKNPFQPEKYRRLRPVFLISVLMLTLLCATFLCFEGLQLFSP